jgi:histidinol-phosphate aminotransferase
MEKVKLPFSVNRPAQIAALAALDDENHVDESRAMNEQGKVYLTREFERMGLEYVPPHGNFIFVKLNREAAPVHKALESRGIIVRPVGVPDALRITIGNPSQNQKFIAALDEILAGKPANASK